MTTIHDSNRDGGEKGNNLGLLPVQGSLRQLLSEWLQCPECGSVDSLEYLSYGEFEDGNDSMIPDGRIHRIRCHECNYAEERTGPKPRP